MNKEEEMSIFRRDKLPEYVEFLQHQREVELKLKKMGQTLKKCKCCGKLKPLTDFYRNPLKKLGRFDICKLCLKKRRSYKTS